MTIELVDGKGGTAHISSEDKAIIHQAKFGKIDMVSDWGDALECTMSSANKATIGTGCASIQGLDWHITSAETVTITNGSQGMKRNDIIAAHYHRDSFSGIEKIELVVLKGAANAMTATDPTVPAGRILSGASDAYMPLWRIPLDGITVGTPVRLFALRTAVWDSVSQILIDNQYGTVTGWRSGLVCMIDVAWRSAVAGSWDSGSFGTLPEGWRPSHTVRMPFTGRDGESQRIMQLEPSGEMTYSNMGGKQHTGVFYGTFTYLAV